MQNIQVLISFVVVALSVLPSSGLMCNQCDTYLSTDEAPTCVEPYTEGDDNLGECEDDDTHCVKTKTVATQVDTESGGLIRQVVVSRFCKNLPENGTRCEEKVGAGSIYITCYCQTDGCNGSPVCTPQLRFLTIFTFLAILLPVITIQASL